MKFYKVEYLIAVPDSFEEGTHWFETHIYEDGGAYPIKSSLDDDSIPVISQAWQTNPNAFELELYNDWIS